MMSRDNLFVPRIIGVVFANGNKTTGPTLSFPFLLTVDEYIREISRNSWYSYRDSEIRDDSGAFFRI